MVQVVRFAVALHDVGKFGVVDVMNLDTMRNAVRNQYHEVRRCASLGICCKRHTGSRVSGVTPHRSNQVTYVLPSVFSGIARNLFMSTVFELIRGRCLSIRRPSSVSNILSRSQGSTGPAVVSPRAAIMSAHHHSLSFKATHPIAETA